MSHKAAVSEKREIYFYGARGPNGYLSNFYRCPFDFDGEIWPTVEHYFQASKTSNALEREWIRNFKSPGAARRAGKQLVPSSKWNSVCEQIMYLGLIAKFSNSELGLKLFQTGHARLIAHAPGDYYWGVGRDGSGENRLGVIMTRVRYQIGNVIGHYSTFQ
jgi:ribA/ribD-fused uncharacterized protein